MSDNGEWLVLNVWLDTEPDTDLIQVVEVDSGNVVTNFDGPLLHDLKVGDDGSVFHQSDGGTSGWVTRLAPGGGEFEMVFDSFPPGFIRWGSLTLLGDEEAGWLGTFAAGSDETAALVVADFSGATETFRLPGVTMGQVGEEQLGELVAPEFVEPAVIWDTDRQRAIVVHADQPNVTVVDFATGEITEHTWAPSSWIDALLTWLVPPAHAKGPSLGVTRNAVLSPSGDLLYVATRRASMALDGSAAVHSIPLGVEVISTDDWTLVNEFDIPASHVALSPDGGHLVATGVTGIDTAISSSSELTGVYIISTETLEVREPPVMATEWIPEIQFSANSEYLYLGAQGGGRQTIVHLENAEILGTVFGSERTVAFGPAAMLSTPIGG